MVIGLALRFALGGVFRAIQGLFGVVARNPWPCACVALAGFSGLLWHQRDQAREQARTWQLAHKAQQAAYRAAGKAAEAKELARYVRVTNEQQEISRAVSQDYASRLAAIRSRVAGLRAQARAAGSASGDKQVSGISAPASGTVAETDCGLVWRSAGAEQAAQLEALVDWVAAQAAVDPNR